MSDDLTVKLVGDNDQLNDAIDDAISRVVDLSDEIMNAMSRGGDGGLEFDVDADTSMVDDAMTAVDELGDHVQAVDAEDVFVDADTNVGDVAMQVEDVSASFDELAAAAAESASDIESEMSKAGSEMEGMGEDVSSTLMDVLGPAAIGALIAGSASEIINGLSSAMSTAVDMMRSTAEEALDLFGVQELAETKMAHVVEATGHAAGFTAEQLKAMASGLQEVTRFGDEATLEAMSMLLTFKNIQGTTFERVTKSAADMATIFGGDLRSNMMRLGRAIDDPVRGLMALTRVGITFTTEQRKQIMALVESGDVLTAQNMILDKLEGKMAGAAGAALDTFSGRLESMSNRAGDVKEQLGGALIPVLDVFFPLLEKGLVAIERSVPLMESAGEVIAEWASDISEFLRPAFEWLVDAGVTSFTVIETVANNWSEAMRAATLSAMLAVVQTGETISHWLGTRLPQLMEWFFDNWGAIWRDIAVAQTTVLTNMGGNIGEFVAGVSRWLTTGSAKFKFTALTEGFESTIEELPEMAERVPSIMEQALRAKLNEVTEGLGEDFAERLKKNKAFLETLFGEGEVKDGVDLTPNPRTGPAPSSKPPKKDEEKKKKEKDVADEEFKASTHSLFGLSDKIAQAAASIEVEDAGLKVAEEELEVMKEVRDEIKKGKGLPIFDDIMGGDIMGEMGDELDVDDLDESEEAFEDRLEGFMEGLESALQTADIGSADGSIDTAMTVSEDVLKGSEDSSILSGLMSSGGIVGATPDAVSAAIATEQTNQLLQITNQTLQRVADQLKVGGLRR